MYYIRGFRTMSRFPVKVLVVVPLVLRVISASAIFFHHLAAAMPSSMSRLRFARLDGCR
jgi:hypothetical protein